MKKYFLILGIGIFLGLGLGSSQASAGELLYKPVNPNFGGNPFNAAPLLANANAQNKFKDPDSQRAGRVPQSAAEAFAERLDRLILSGLSRDVLDLLFGGGDPLSDLTFDDGINTIEVDGTLRIITITDNDTGEVTTVNY